MARGSVIKRCAACRRQKLKESAPCNHDERTYGIFYRVGKKQIFKTVGPNKKEAEAVLAKTISEVNNGTFYQAEEISLNDFIDKWLDEYALPRIKANTLYKYKNTLQKHQFQSRMMLRPNSKQIIRTSPLKPGSAAPAVLLLKRARGSASSAAGKSSSLMRRNQSSSTSRG